MADRFQLARLAWEVLARSAGLRQTLTYGDLAEAIGFTSGRVMRIPLSVIQTFCLERDLPPLTSIVVNKGTGLPGTGFIAWSGELDEAHRRVFDFDWSLVPAPFPAGDPVRASAARSPNDPNSFEVQDRDVLVNGRGPFQAHFRNRLMNVYGGCCALCETRGAEFLVASHVVPWALDCSNRLNPANGLLLCRTHDAAFESGVICVRANLEVELREDRLKDLGSALVGYLRQNTSGRVRCGSPRYRPAKEFLERRLQFFLRTDTLVQHRSDGHDGIG